MPISEVADVEAPTRPAAAVGKRIEWRETRNGVQFRRAGVVYAAGPRDNSAWVTPDTHLDGDGTAVVVYRHPSRGLVRTAGDPRADFYSTAEWQDPKSLPRAYLRRDQLVNAEGLVVAEVAVVHAADPQCRCSGLQLGVRLGWVERGERIERGRPEVLADVYVYAGRFMHTLSRRPVQAGGTFTQIGQCFAIKRQNGPLAPGLPDDNLLGE